MLAGKTERFLETAAAETLTRIRQDRERVGPRLKPLLEHIEAHLFDADLDVNQLKRACNVRDNTIPIQFHSELGMPPHAYIEDCRLKTACRLLRDTDLKVWQIADLLGYSSIQVFSRAFTRWSGIRPTTYRKKERRGEAPATSETTPTTLRVETLRRALKGELDAGRVEEIMRRLLALYPSSSRRIAHEASALAARAEAVRRPAPSKKPVRASLDALEVERMRAESVWHEIEDRDLEEQRDVVARKLRFTTPALFELLHAKGREVGRRNREEGVHMAELALASLDALDAEAVGVDARDNLRARAWAWLGNARRLNLDFRGAEEALGTAERNLSAREPDLVAQADILAIKAALRWYQRRLHEALALSHEAIALYRRAGQPVPLARALTSRATVLRSQDRFAESMPDLEEALALVDGSDDAFLLSSVLQGMMYSCIGVGDLDRAETLHERACGVAEALPAGGPVHHHLIWLGGLVAHGRGHLDHAETRLRQALDAFTADDSPYLAALVGLDLAMLLAEQGRHTEVAKIAAEVLPILDALQVRREALAAFGLLRRAVDNQRVSFGILQRVRRALVQDTTVATPPSPLRRR